MARFGAWWGNFHKSITSSNANAAGDEFVVPRKGSRPASDVTMQVSEVNGGSYTALEVDLEGSVDGTEWVQLAAFTTALGANATGAISSAVKGFMFFRARKVSSTTNLGVPLVTAMLSFN